MRHPDSQYDRCQGKADAEIQRGCGHWPLQPHACELEPPWEPFDPESLGMWECYVNDWEADWSTNVFGQVIAGQRLYRIGDPLVLPAADWAGDHADLAVIVIEQFPDDEATLEKAVQLLLSLPRPRRPVSFEVFGRGPCPEWDLERIRALTARREAGEIDASTHVNESMQCISGFTDPYVMVQLVAHRDDAAAMHRLVISHYPNSAVVLHQHLSDRDMDIAEQIASSSAYPAGTLALSTVHCRSLRTLNRLESDPLGVAIAAMDRLGEQEWAMLQVLFAPAHQPWGQSAREALWNPYRDGGEWLFDGVSDRLLQDKFGSPLFAVSVRIMASERSVFDQLYGWSEQLAAPPQGLELISDDTSVEESLANAVGARCTYRPGMLLNVNELASLVHLPGPSVVSERLRRVTSRTRPAPAAEADPGSVLLGYNVHRGEQREARIDGELRSRHCYIAGASGTGKSTLLLNMICQDIAGGHGVGVLDPHGDLVEDVLARVPAERVADVMYFNATDQAYPPAFNILEHGGDRSRLVGETVSTIRKFFPDAWGVRLEHILKYALATVSLVKRKDGAMTLYDVQRLLKDRDYRERVVAVLPEGEVADFWHHEFPADNSQAIGAVLNKLSPLLFFEKTRNIICQRRTRFDFDEILSGGKIFLANLSPGLIGKEAAGILGTFIMSKLVQAAFRRRAGQRRTFHLYIDEFQNFVDLAVSFETILAEARKFNLSLIAANQYVGQLTDPVRQAVFGNVGSLITFRLGVSDARLLSQEFGEFTSDEILSLERGQALARLGGSRNTFNLATVDKPGVADDQTAVIVADSRKRFATPVREVNRLFTRRRPAAKPAAMHARAKAGGEPGPPQVPREAKAEERSKPEWLPPDTPDDMADFV